MAALLLAASSMLGLHLAVGTATGSLAGDLGTCAAAVTAPGGERSSAAPVVLRRSDFETLTEITDRFQQVHFLGLRLIGEGFAFD